MRLPGFLRALPPAERRDSLENPGVDLISALVAETDGNTITTISLTPIKAMRLAAVYACVRVVAESIASLPFPIYKQTDRSREEVRDDPRWKLLNDQPNPEQTAINFWENLLGHALLWGNGYAYIERNKAGMPMNLWPLMPDQTTTRRTTQNNLVYVSQVSPTGPPAMFEPSEIIHLQAILGLNPVRTLREAISSGMAAEEYSGRFWANNARPGGVISFPDTLEEDEYQEFRRRWNAQHQGLKRSQLLGILTGGAEWKEVGMSPELAQFIETRNFNVREIARMFRVPPHMIGDLQGTVTRASIEQQAIEFVTYTLRPWVVRLEQAVGTRMFDMEADQEPRVQPEMNVNALLRGDTKARYDAYAQGIQFGFLSRADARELENLPYVEDLERFLVPANMIDAQALPTEATPAPASQQPAPPTEQEKKMIDHILRLIRAGVYNLPNLETNGNGHHDDEEDLVDLVLDP